MKVLALHDIDAFRHTVLEYYERAGRHDLPWRESRPDKSFDPYQILVSEIMLQQTQVSRVIPKYLEFLHKFPTVDALAVATTGDVVRQWQGLGYNRRAVYLWQAACIVASTHSFPDTIPGLRALPGVGANTAGAIMAYAYNVPAVFVETNIRTVVIQHFTRDDSFVSDSFVRDVISQTLDRNNPRQFYWAMMDYGAYLKKQGSGNTKSKHYHKQSPFVGSRRAVRGAVIRALSERAMTMTDLAQYVDDARLKSVLSDLQQEGMIRYAGKYYRL